MSDNQFTQFEKDPAVAAVKQLKTHLAICIIQAVRNNGRTASANARKLKTTTKCFKMLMQGDVSPYCLEDLFEFAVRAGLTVENAIKKRPKQQVAMAIKISPATA